MFNLRFDGIFELKYPNEFLEDLNQLKEKHQAHYMGKIQVQDLGEYVDFQLIEDTPEENPVSEETHE